MPAPAAITAIPTAAVTSRCEMITTGRKPSRSKAWKTAKQVEVSSSASTAKVIRIATTRVVLCMSASPSPPSATTETGRARTSLSASVFAKYSSTRRRSRAISRVRIASWPKPASTVTSAANERPKVNEPKASFPSIRAITTKKATETSFEPTSAAAL